MIASVSRATRKLGVGALHLSVSPDGVVFTDGIRGGFLGGKSPSHQRTPRSFWRCRVQPTNLLDLREARFWITSCLLNLHLPCVFVTLSENLPIATSQKISRSNVP